MGQQRVETGEQTYELDEAMTIAELKDEVGAAENDMATFAEEDGSWGTLNDGDTVADIPEDARIAFQPKDTIFGGAGRDERR